MTEQPGSQDGLLFTDARLETQPQVLKQDDAFAVFNACGDIDTTRGGEDGLFFRDTRYLSRYQLRLDDLQPLPLRAAVGRDDGVLNVDLTNPGFAGRGPDPFASDQLHLSRRLYLWQGACYERLRLHNYAMAPVSFTLQWVFDADFADIFEVRGQHRRRRGVRLPSDLEAAAVTLSYCGVDDVRRVTRLAFSPAPQTLSTSHAEYRLTLAAGARTTLYVTIACEPGQNRPTRFGDGLRQARRRLQQRRRDAATLYSSNELFNEWFNRSAADLYLLVSDTPHGPYPVAGIPWFSTAFGRDALISALLCLWADPGLARGVLRYLAAHQADVLDPAREAEPGKILHETRRGEMAALGEVPFGCYYGSADATPLFLLLAGAYFERTDDLALVGALWPALEAALDWIDRFGDVDGDGFVEYHKQTPSGLDNQGWKDSHDAVCHADGTLAEGPIALCELQAYVYAAKRRLAPVAAALGHHERSLALTRQAERLRRQFDDAFWCEDLGTYALALDGAKRPCRVRASNAGHALFAGIATERRARRVAATLFDAGSFSGWGLRTLDRRERRFNPLAYHNGSVWPHDNALIALGLARYGLRDQVLRLFTATFDSALHMPLYRLPELYCGFRRVPASPGPIRYPQACAPQAWASAAVFGLLQACLGLSFEPRARRVWLRRAALPASVQRLQIRQLEVGGARVELSCQRHAGGVRARLDADAAVEVCVVD